MTEVMKQRDYEEKALIYAEKYGILNHTLKGNTMVYIEEFNEKEIYYVEVNLENMKEKRRIK